MASGEQEVDISDRDVWDDSALIKHWDASLAEYKKYHSLEAQGHDDGDQRAPVAEGPDVEMEERQVQGEQKEYDDEQEEEMEGEEMVEDRENQGNGDDDVREETNPPPPPPGAVISLDNLDDGVKQLAMAWYWAGYYHGLEVGKKR